MVRDTRADCAWVPPELVIDEDAVAFLLVMSLPGGVAVRLTEYRDDPHLRRWMREWFIAQREKLAKVKGELDWPIAFTGLVATTAALNVALASRLARTARRWRMGGNRPRY